MQYEFLLNDAYSGMGTGSYAFHLAAKHTARTYGITNRFSFFIHAKSNKLLLGVPWLDIAAATQALCNVQLPKWEQRRPVTSTRNVEQLYCLLRRTHYDFTSYGNMIYHFMWLSYTSQYYLNLFMWFQCDRIAGLQTRSCRWCTGGSYPRRRARGSSEDSGNQTGRVQSQTTTMCNQLLGLNDLRLKSIFSLCSHWFQFFFG